MGAVLAIAGSALMGGAVPVRAQRRSPTPPDLARPLQAAALQDLRFGTLFPGIPVSVRPFNLDRVGVFEIRGPHGASVRVDLALPASLVADVSGTLLPLSFGSGDAQASATRDAASGSIFNPHGPFIGSLTSSGFLYLRLGGTASPAVPQEGGAYRATISMTVYDLGS